jgi:hypothetical protein
MGQAAHHYLIFETRGGFCGITWNTVGITRFQLPAKSAEGAQRMLLRRVSGAEPGTPTPEVAEAIAAVKHYFEGKRRIFPGSSSTSPSRTHFSDVFIPRRGRSDGAARPLMALWRRNSALDRKLRAMSARPWQRIRWR